MRCKLNFTGLVFFYTMVNLKIPFSQKSFKKDNKYELLGINHYLLHIELGRRYAGDSWGSKSEAVSSKYDKNLLHTCMRGKEILIKI